MFWSPWCFLPPSDYVAIVIWCESVGDLHAVQSAGNACGEGVAARPEILLRECGVALQGAVVCAFVE